jgi:hypothetical protein
MSRHQQPLFFEHYRLAVIQSLLVASLIAIASGLSPIVVEAAERNQAPPQTRFREIAPGALVELRVCHGAIRYKAVY